MELNEIKCSVCPIKAENTELETKLAAVKEEMCDKYCKHPWYNTQERLDVICEYCPLNRLKV